MRVSLLDPENNNSIELSDDTLEGSDYISITVNSLPPVEIALDELAAAAEAFITKRKIDNSIKHNGLL